MLRLSKSGWRSSIEKLSIFHSSTLIPIMDIQEHSIFYSKPQMKNLAIIFSHIIKSSPTLSKLLAVQMLQKANTIWLSFLSGSSVVKDLSILAPLSVMHASTTHQTNPRPHLAPLSVMHALVTHQTNPRPHLMLSFEANKGFVVTTYFTWRD